LRKIFFYKTSNKNIELYPRSIKIYESHAQNFLKLVLVLLYITSGLLLRLLELLSIIV
ncbi:hypothetical protein BGZ60DRAFT_392746, partial [Tricladium varicosporioides]